MFCDEKNHHDWGSRGGGGGGEGGFGGWGGVGMGMGMGEVGLEFSKQ